MPKLSEENDRFWFLASRFLPGLHNGMGGYHYDAIGAVYDEYGVDRDERPILFDRAIVLIRAYEAHREEERESRRQEEQKARR